MLTAQQKALIAKRQVVSKNWPRIGTTLTLLWFFFGLYFLFGTPEFISPGVILRKIWFGEVWKEDVSSIAALAPLLFIIIWLLVLGLLLNNSSWVAHEKKLLGIISDLQSAKKIATNPFVVAGVWGSIAIYCWFFFL